MRGLNRVMLSGNVTGKLSFQETSVKKIPACSFSVVSDRRSPTGGQVSALVKVNAYGPWLVNLCRNFLTKGVYVVVEGELMNRKGSFGELTEVRAGQIIFPAASPLSRDHEPAYSQNGGSSRGGHSGRPLLEEDADDDLVYAEEDVYEPVEEN